MTEQYVIKVNIVTSFYLRISYKSTSIFELPAFQLDYIPFIFYILWKFTINSFIRMLSLCICPFRMWHLVSSDVK